MWSGSTIFGFQVSNPEQYGIVSLDESGSPTAIVEKPDRPDSNWAVPGIYFYDNRVFDIAASLEPSGRGELEISDVNARYLAEGRMTLHCLGKEYSWFDAGTPDRFLDAANYIRDLTESLGRCVMVPEEIAHSEGWISTGQLAQLGRSMLPSSYGKPPPGAVRREDDVFHGFITESFCKMPVRTGYCCSTHGRAGMTDVIPRHMAKLRPGDTQDGIDMNRWHPGLAPLLEHPPQAVVRAVGRIGQNPDSADTGINTKPKLAVPGRNPEQDSVPAIPDVRRPSSRPERRNWSSG